MKNISYKDYVIEAPLRKEGVEWSYNYSYNANDQESPRVLLLGDSICNGYQPHVRKVLEHRVNVSYWISSFCVTRERYFRMLEMVLEENRYDLVLFNHGAHCNNELSLWADAYRSAARFIKDKLNGVKMGFVYCAPTRLDGINERSIKLNAVAADLAAEYGDTVIDLWTPFAELGQGDDVFIDNFHFARPRQEEMGRIVANAVCEILGISEDGDVVQVGNEHGPSGAIK
ncbi:MAG: SGNH/GDSL hydrolase family protein [Clostridia bacterium]|nr:SGNH/GDSL hydrolase family protein [Clostridia bacterium]